jgi:hypothetical protein
MIFLINETFHVLSLENVYLAENENAGVRTTFINRWQIAFYSNIDKVQCLKYCSDNWDCDSVEYQSVSRNCIILKYTPTPVDVVSRTNSFIFYTGEIKVK